MLLELKQIISNKVTEKEFIPTHNLIKSLHHLQTEDIIFISAVRNDPLENLINAKIDQEFNKQIDTKKEIFNFYKSGKKFGLSDKEL